MTADTVKQPVRPRFAGILAHPTSFPGPYGIGDLGKGAYAFIDFLEASGQSLWQCLPTGPTGFGDSPYQSFSAFAGQPLIISPGLLLEEGLLLPEDLDDMPQFNPYVCEYGKVIPWKISLLRRAYAHFSETRHAELRKEFRAFCKAQEDWLDDYTLFMAVKDDQKGRSWLEWEPELRFMDDKTRRSAERRLKDTIGFYAFQQFIFFRQWSALKDYANRKGISIVGDIPIFVAPDSVDVWANKSLFQLDEEGFPRVVAGVPPDYFSAVGQLWGNPLYDWAEHKKTGYAWWIRRIRCQLQLVDYLRIDHFRGFESYWTVPYGAENAIGGKWVKGPGMSLFKAIQKELGEQLPIFAEDLGIITEQVRQLRDQLGFPGMKILQFAFEDAAESDYLPYLFGENCICYTGTHDNNTTIGWYFDVPEATRERVRRYCNSNGNEIHWDLIRLALSSTARYAIYPMQDLLGYGGDCRMNTPGVAAGNWAWRFREDCLSRELADKLLDLCKIYGRDRFRMEGEPK